MIDARCLGPDVDRSRISPDATVSGSSWLTGPRTAIAAGAVVRDSRLHDVAVAAGASVIDSIILAQGPARSHRCDAAGRTVVRSPDQPAVGAGASVSGCTFLDVAVGGSSRVENTWAQDTRIGDSCRVSDARINITEIDAHCTIIGPTEIGEAYLGRHTRIDRPGYYEGIFSNRFHRLRFDEAAGQLRVIETINLPHVSRYGANSINSTNSGKLLPRNGEPLRSLGPPAGLWKDLLLSHEQIELAPCCWILPWTKMIGQSPAPHATDEELVNDEYSTYMMPFSLAGFGPARITRGLVAPGEMSVGLGYKQRRGGWAFTYAPGAVIAMVARLREALEPEHKSLADRIVAQAIETAIEMTRAQAARRGVDLSAPPDRQRAGWPRWIAATFQILRAHADGDLWRFRDGRPLEWRLEGGRWTHPRMDRLLAVAPDALANQKSEDELFEVADAAESAARLALPTDSLSGADGPARIDPKADVAADAFIGPGSRIGPGSVVRAGAMVWNSTVERSTVGPGARVERSRVTDSIVQDGTVVRCCRIEASTIGPDSLAQCSAVARSRLAGRSNVTAFSDVRDVRSDFPAILGGTFGPAEIAAPTMSWHLASSCADLQVVPVRVAVAGRQIDVPAIPMLGGGSIIRGRPDRPVVMQACFIGANAIIEPGCFVGLGCFVLGRLGPEAGLLPFTLSSDLEGQGAARHQIGAVLGLQPSTVITHIIAWTYNAAAPDLGPAVARMIVQGIEDGRQAIEWELARRRSPGGSGPQPGAAVPHRFAQYKSLPQYSDEQLAAGLEEYCSALASGAWDMEFVAGQLRFSSAKGTWVERSGSASWQAT